jgi:transcriptional regulator with XRE-family HTH domain
LRGLELIQYDPTMEQTRLFVRAWRLSQQKSLEALAMEANLSASVLEAIEITDYDCALSTIESLAQALGILPAWLFADPAHFKLLFRTDDGEEDEGGEQPWSSPGVDPVLERIVRASGYDRSLYVLLTVLLQDGDAKLLRAAEMSLRSLVKQSKQATVPWQSRPSGHFEPPND